ncbi:hypothetical protein [Candidatus Magnetobacterium casense]|uniref:Capsid protein n=1 Tax=Candidatus Magnetobacterium casense TaxID=1455061 RepID=A0ABS6S3W1_9BACT|nr:hypothetical protein [Candidatus Magnetobacterium casensis]MBV6343541.1 hypothetical protein [Candidatus Magnetobacterium casensis]
MKRFYNSGYGGIGTQRGSNGIVNLVRPPRSLTPSFGGPFGQVFDTEVNYCDYFSMNPTLGAATSTLFLANGLYDPTVSSGGHQPHGYDYLSQIYDNWQVLSSTIEVALFSKIVSTVQVSGTGPVNAQLVGSFLSIGVRDTSTTMTGLLTTLTDILERPNIKTVFVNSNDTPTTIRASFSMPKFYGRSRGLDDSDITGTTSADPTDKVYYHVIFGSNNGTDDLESHNFVARIKYKCRWFNPKNLVQS